jgi:hypothetical protein
MNENRDGAVLLAGMIYLDVARLASSRRRVYRDRRCRRPRTPVDTPMSPAIHPLVLSARVSLTARLASNPSRETLRPRSVLALSQFCDPETIPVSVMVRTL